MKDSKKHTGWIRPSALCEDGQGCLYPVFPFSCFLLVQGPYPLPGSEAPLFTFPSGKGPGLEMLLKDARILKMEATQESFAQPQMKTIKNVTSSTWGGVWTRQGLGCARCKSMSLISKH